MAAAFFQRAAARRSCMSLATSSNAGSCATRYLGANARPVQRLPTHARHFVQSSALAVKKYSEDHEWIELDGDGKIGTMGITNYAAKALGDVVFVELPTLDTQVAKGDTLGSVESVKSASDIFSPVTGTVVEANSILEDKPGEINKAPEGNAWIAKISIEDPSEVEGLMDADAYLKFTEE